MSVAIIGTRGTGKSTLVGLLQQSMEKFTNEYPEKLAYFMDSNTTRVCLENIRNPLLSKSFPVSTVRGDFEKLSFLIGFEAKRRDKIKYLTKKFSMTRMRDIFDNYDNMMILTVLDVSGEDVEEFGRHPRITEIIKSIFISNILVVLVDTSKFTRELNGKDFQRMQAYDAEMAKILSAYEGYRAKNMPGEILHPVVFFTKMDMLDKEILNRLDNHKDLDMNKNDMYKDYREDDVQKDGTRLLREYLPGVAANLTGSRNVKVPMHEAKFYFSWVGLEKEEGMQSADAGLMVDRYETINGDELKTNVYPMGHYRAFIKKLSELSHDYSDRESLVKEYLDRD